MHRGSPVRTIERPSLRPVVLVIDRLQQQPGRNHVTDGYAEYVAAFEFVKKAHKSLRRVGNLLPTLRVSVACRSLTTIIILVTGKIIISNRSAIDGETVFTPVIIQVDSAHQVFVGCGITQGIDDRVVEPGRVEKA